MSHLHLSLPRRRRNKSPSHTCTTRAAQRRCVSLSIPLPTILRNLSFGLRSSIWKNLFWNGYREISEWSIERPAQQPETPLGSEMAQKVLLLQLRQSLLLLHRAAGQRATLPSQQTYARTTCIGVATSIIDFYEKMRSEVRAALLALRNDVFQCALSICYDISWPDPWRSKCLSNLLWHAS